MAQKQNNTKNSGRAESIAPDSSSQVGPEWSGRRLLIIVFCISAVLRIIYVLASPPNVDQIGYDEVEYEILARNVLAGNGFGYGEGELSSFRPPLWPYTLAGIYSVFGRSHTAAKLCMALVGSMLPILIILITRNMLPRRESLACGVVVAVYPPLIVVLIKRFRVGRRFKYVFAYYRYGVPGSCFGDLRKMEGDP